jgi:flagellar biosynthesis protein FlhF
MSVRKFIAPTAREALREIRNVLGEEAIIISNRKVEQGVEIIVLDNEDIAQMTGRSVAHNFRSVEVESRLKIQAQAAKVVIPEKKKNDEILDEIKSMHSMLQQQISAMAWSDVQRQDPHRAGLLSGLLNAGFSTSLARQLVDKMPVGKTQGAAWIKQVLKKNLIVSGVDEDVVTNGGIYALIGPTGVGKTTTVVRYGADKVALLTTDSYRIGAYEQLKIYGKILGVAVHAVKNTDDLRMTLSALRNKHLVLIDTVGMGQRDERVANQNEMFDETHVKRLLLLNSTSSGDTLEDVVRMYHSGQVIGCIATKLDEAVNLGAVLDVALRHRLVMHYMANGQRVPEDLHPVNIDYLLHRTIKSAEHATPYTTRELEFPILMAAGGPPQRAGINAGLLASAGQTGQLRMG